jgi:hypothetical protein
MRLSLSLLPSPTAAPNLLLDEQVSVCLNEALASLFIQFWHVWRCLFTGRADFFFWVVITTFNIYSGADFLFCLLQLCFDQSAKGDLVIYNSRHDQSAKGIDLMNNTSIIIRILFAVTLFQHSPLTRRVFYNNIRQERGHHQQHRVSERTTLSTTSWNTD